MPTVYVYAPFTGRIAGLDNYCSGGAHAPCRNAQPTQVSPVDIATSGVVLKIYFYASRSSKVYISTENRCCCSNTVLMVEQGSLIFSQLKVVMWVLFGLGM